MAESFHLEVVTPQGAVLAEDVVEITAPGIDGEFGVLPRHARYMTALGAGELRYVTSSGQDGLLAVAGGFAEVGPDGVTVLAQTAEEAEEIDIARAEAAVQRAQARLAEPGDETDSGRAGFALERSLARLRVAKARGIKPTRSAIKTTEMPIPGERSAED